MSRHKKHRIKLKSLYVWHRYLGLSVAILAILLATTGLCLNHTEQLQLDKRYVHNPWLLDWYGIKTPDRYTAFATSLGSVVLMDNRLFVEREIVADEIHRLDGAIAVNGLIVLAEDGGLLLLTPQGEIIDRMQNLDGVPETVTRIGRTKDQNPVIATAAGNFTADSDFLKWRPVQGENDAIEWSIAMRLDATDERILSEESREHTLPYERVFLDLHSGRLFGRYGPFVMDAAAVLMLFLAGSGTLIWLKRKRTKS